MKFLERDNFDFISFILWTITIFAMFIWIPLLWAVITAALAAILFFWNEEIRNYIFIEISLLPLKIFEYVQQNLIPDWLQWLLPIFEILCVICLFLFILIATTGISDNGWGRDGGGGDGV